MGARCHSFHNRLMVENSLHSVLKIYEQEKILQKLHKCAVLAGEPPFISSV